jgi:hypothetical protein
MIALITAPLLFVGCSDDDTTSSSASKASIMVVHASPNAPGVDLFVDNNKVNSTALNFPANTGYLQVDGGTRAIRVNATGTSTAVINAQLPVEAGKSYTVFAVDSVSKIAPLVLNDNLATPATGKAHVRFVHLSPNAPAVDVGVKNGPTLFLNRAFNRQITAAQEAFTPVDAATYDLEVRLAGQATVVLPLNGIKLEAGKIYTVFARGFVGGTGAQALNAEIIVNR